VRPRHGGDRVPGCREIAIEGETGLLVPVDVVEALADVMARLAEDADLRTRFGGAARRLVEAKFSADTIGQETIALYDKMIGR